MAVSRPFLLALIGIALLGATVFAVRNAPQSADSGGAAAPAASSQPATPAAQLSPEEALQSALSTNPGSARFHVEASLKANGATGTLEVHGATDDSGKDPRVDLDVNVDALGTEVNGGFVTTGGEAWFTRGDTGYLVPQEVWDGLRKQGSSPVPTPGLPFDPAKWVRDVKDEGTESIAGVETQHVSASIDTGAVLRDLRQALPGDAARQVEDSVERADFELWVGTKDRILRRLTADVEFAVAGSGPVEVTLDVQLSDVGRPQRIERPAKVVEELPGGEFGAFMRTALQGASSAGGGDVRAVSAGLRTGNNPQKLQRALRDNRKVVLLFMNARGLDDEIVKDSLRAVRRATNALTLTDSVLNVDRYGSLVESLGVTQTPSIVLIDRNGKARLVEGYVDAESLVQVVADAR
ncbi:MAG TPA: hypothetical protein VHJ37_06640 [Thermoleophilaceae bacterium]|nr:hypothetical protein [Thermoleophilaceae bacterium]